MPRCFIQTSRNYNGRMPPELEKDDKTRNHHRTVTRSGQRYVKPAPPKPAKSRRSPTARCRDRLDYFQSSPSRILQRSRKLAKMQKGNPWSQLSVVTRFYLGRQLPELDVTGLKPHDRPVWPADFPCSDWASPDEYPLRCDQVRSPYEEDFDDKTVTNKPRLKFTDLKPTLPSKNYITPIPQKRHISTLSPACQESLRALCLKSDIKREKDGLVYPLILSEENSEFKISEVKNAAFPNGTIMGKCKVFTITPQSGPNKRTPSELNPVLRIKLQAPPKNKTSSQTVSKETSTSASLPPFLTLKPTSVWTKPKGNDKKPKTTDIRKEGMIEGKDQSNNNNVNVVNIEKEGPVVDQTLPKTGLPNQVKCSKSTSTSGVSPPSVIKIVTTPKSGKNDHHQYKCDDCDRVFTVPSALASHLRTHTKERNTCDHCGKVFTRSWLLKGHMRTHTGERPFNCPEPGCDKAFADKSNLRSHLLIHTVTTKSFVCPKCRRAFAQKRYLHKHMLEVCRTVPDSFHF